MNSNAAASSRRRHSDDGRFHLEENRYLCPSLYFSVICSSSSTTQPIPLIVGNFLGSDALAAVSSSGSLIFLLVGFFNGISVGAGVVIARYFGARDKDNLSKAIHTDVAFGLGGRELYLQSSVLSWLPGSTYMDGDA